MMNPIQRPLGLVVLGALLALAGSAKGDDRAAEGGRPNNRACGALQPLETTQIRARSMRVRLAFSSEGVYDATVEYRLANNGPASTVQFGIPTSWRAFEFLGAPPSPPEEMAAGANAITIATARGQVKCRPQVAGPALTALDPGIEVWCVASIDVAHGEAIPLVVEYSSDSQTKVRAATVRTTWTFSPATYWLGRVDEVSIAIDPGPLAGHMKLISPSGAREVDGVIRWSESGVGAAQLAPVILDTEAHQGSWGPEARRKWGDGAFDGTWLRTPVPLSAAASSALAPQGRHAYGPDLAIDSNRATAWCEGAKGDGEGESLSVTVKLPVSAEDRECRILDVELVSGLAKDDAVYRANGRVIEGRIERCEDPAVGFAFRLEERSSDRMVWPGLREEERASDRAQEIAIPPGALGADPACLKLVIAKVRRGNRYPDTCVSEFTPRLYCRVRPQAAKPDAGK